MESTANSQDPDLTELPAAVGTEKLKAAEVKEAGMNTKVTETISTDDVEEL